MLIHHYQTSPESHWQAVECWVRGGLQQLGPRLYHRLQSITLLPRHSVYSLLSAWELCFSMWPSFHLPLSKKVQRHTRTHTHAHLAVAGFHHIVGSWDSCVNGRGQGGGEDEDGLGLQAPRSGRGRERGRPSHRKRALHSTWPFKVKSSPKTLFTRE